MTVSETTTTQTLRVVYATNIQIRYQASDSSVVPVPTEKNLPPIGSGSNSAGKKAGIAIGIIIGVCVLGGGGYYLGRRRSRQQAYSDIGLQGNPGPASGDAPPAYPGK